MKTSFTTEPKTRRHGLFISGQRARAFMHHLWDKNLRIDVSYDTLTSEWNALYEGGKRTLEKYCGVPPHIVRASRKHMSRMNSRNGVTDQYNYAYTSHVKKKNGLLETLGFITWNKQLYEETKPRRFVTQYRYRLNHEMMPYYTEQVELDVLPPAPPLPENVRKEGSCSDVTSSVDNLRVCSVVVGSDGVDDASDSRPVYTTTREVRERIGNTHANRLGETNISETPESGTEVEGERV